MAERPEAGWRAWVRDRSTLPRMEANTGPEPAGFQPAPANPQPFSAGMHLQPPFDPIELLPPAAAEKLRLLRQRRADAHAVIPEFEAIREASMAKIEAANALKRFTDHPQDGGFDLKPDDRRVIEAQRTLDRATEQFERIKQRSKERTEAWQAASGALANAETWLKSGKPSVVLMQDHQTGVPKPAKGEAGLLDQLEVRRRRVRELGADLHRIRSAPFPSVYAKQQMREQIEALAMQGTPSVSLLIEHDGKIDFQTQQVKSTVYNAQPGAVAFAEVPDAVALTCWLHKSALIAALDREIATEADDGAALSHEARQQQEAEVMGDLLDAERTEAALVFAAWEQGLVCEHRSDCSPVALLGLQLVSAPRADGLPPSSPERAGYNLIGRGR